MTLDELCREYTVHYYGGDERYRPAAYEVSVAHREGVAAILTALRNEISRSNDHDLDYSVSRYIDEILASEGVKAEPTVGQRLIKAAKEAAAIAKGEAPAAPVCVWTKSPLRLYEHSASILYRTGCGADFFYNYKQCQGCGKPISFKSEAAR